ncbi:uncharacterized protein LOC128127334 [Lactuca sativa]|uniref:uncharacterized protein LOC128127334 n=1 Tax=Lactuca sativa TaxID=4236 RepID=UPI0022AED3D0|nr:uncharacterized protein LOC128127334 [Lactuca sativa]
MISMQIANSVGGPTRAPLLVLEEYDHWKVRMERFLLAKEKGEQIWRFVTHGPHVPIRTVVRDAAAQLMRKDEVRPTPLTADDIEKLHADQIAFSKMVFGVPPSLFEHIKLCKLAKEIWDTLLDLIEGSENMKDKRLTSVVNDFDTFTTTPGESVASASNRYRIIVNNMTAHRIVRTPLEYNLKFINSLGKGWGNVKSCLQSNVSLKKLKLYQLFDELQGHESNVAQTIRELSGGPLTLVSSSESIIPNTLAPEPYKPMVPLPQQSPTSLPTHNYPNSDFETLNSELRFQQEFALLSMKYKRPFNSSYKSYQNRFNTPHQNHPQPYTSSEPKQTSENPQKYEPNLTKPHSTPKSSKNLNSEKPKILCHKCGHAKHFAKDCLADAPQKPKIKDSAYYVRKAQELAESEKAFVTTVSRDVEGYWSSGDDDDDVVTGRNMCLMARKTVVCDEGYWSSGSENEEDHDEPNYCYMATNDPPGRSIVQQVKSMIYDNNFDLTLCEPYLNQIQTDMNIIYKAYESAIEASENKDCELSRLRLRFEDKKLKIESLEHELVMSKDECIILQDKFKFTYFE